MKGNTMTNESSNNYCRLRGRLTADPEVRTTATNKAVVNFSLAIDECWSSQGEMKKRVEFARVVAWEILASKVAAFQKGQLLSIEGRLQTRSWDDKETNQKKYITEVVATSVAADSDTVQRPIEATGGGTAAARAVLSPRSHRNFEGASNEPRRVG